MTFYRSYSAAVILNNIFASYGAYLFFITFVLGGYSIKLEFLFIIVPPAEFIKYCPGVLVPLEIAVV